jgi:hypothetical protein
MGGVVLGESLRGQHQCRDAAADNARECLHPCIAEGAPQGRSALKITTFLRL